jgi:acyl phosphate:glycerol-3-phosphate acyltransferase
MIIPIVLLVAAYLLGGIPFGYVLVKLKSGQDVRSMGSGNIGATNVVRTAGRAIGVLTLLLDIAKGYVAVWLMGRFTAGDPAWMSAAAVVVMLGHAFPVFLQFKGGKAVASFVGAYLALTPWAVLACAIIFFAIVAVTRYISLGSILAAALFPFAVWMILHPVWPVLAAAFFCAALVVWRHRSNMQRLRAGTENVFSFGGRQG